MQTILLSYSKLPENLNGLYQFRQDNHLKLIYSVYLVSPLEINSTSLRKTDCFGFDINLNKCLNSVYTILELNSWMLEICFINQEHILFFHRTKVWFPDIRWFLSACTYKREPAPISSIELAIHGHIGTRRQTYIQMKI